MREATGRRNPVFDHLLLQRWICPFVSPRHDGSVDVKDRDMMAGRGGNSHLHTERIDESLKLLRVMELALCHAQDSRLLTKSLDLLTHVSVSFSPGVEEPEGSQQDDRRHVRSEGQAKGD